MFSGKLTRYEGPKYGGLHLSLFAFVIFFGMWLLMVLLPVTSLACAWRSLTALNLSKPTICLGQPWRATLGISLAESDLLKCVLRRRDPRGFDPTDPLDSRCSNRPPLMGFRVMGVLEKMIETPRECVGRLHIVQNCQFWVLEFVSGHSEAHSEFAWRRWIPHPTPVYPNRLLIPCPPLRRVGGWTYMQGAAMAYVEPLIVTRKL